MHQPTLNELFAAELEHYARAVGLENSTFCQRAAGDWRLVDRLREGGTTTLKKVQRVREYMARHHPDIVYRRAKAA